MVKLSKLFVFSTCTIHNYRLFAYVDRILTEMLSLGLTILNWWVVKQQNNYSNLIVDHPFDRNRGGPQVKQTLGEG